MELAIYLALKACGIKEGDEVIVQNITFITSLMLLKWQVQLGFC